MKYRSLILFASAGLLIACAHTATNSPIPSNKASSDSELFETISRLDQQLFNEGFNQCKIDRLEILVDEDFEFYHDKAGTNTSKAQFVSSFRDGLCKMNYRAQRELIAGSMQVFPLYNTGELYGAIQMSDHAFYALQPGQEKRLTSTASMTSLWVIVDGDWKFRRGLSYNHVAADE